ncbi:hypothetical protein Tco_0703888 [Tanacetum coccineum]|uniref:Reverse transcriptase domain-containing protein n=1 Tax=Tanacetum coccineum TaxID=301880 RepID=A0ABQ4Y1J9_9ASTR
MDDEPMWAADSVVAPTPGSTITIPETANEVAIKDFDALLDEGSEILHSIEGTILEEKLFAEFDEFMAMTADENSESESDTEEPPFKKITFNTDYKIKTSLEEPPTDLELKPLSDNLEYVFLEEPSFLPVIISSQLSEENKNKLISVLKRHKQAFAWKRTDILGICPSFYYQNQDSHNSFSRQSHYDPNDSEKSLTELNNDVRNDLEDFKRRIRSMRTVHWKLYDSDDRKTTGVLPNKKSKTVNQEPQAKTDFEKSITKFLDGQRVSNMFVKNNVNDMILKMKQNEKNFQTIFKNMERKIDEWSKSQNVSSEHTDRTDPPPPQAHTEQVNVVFTGSEKSDDHPKILKDPSPPIIVNNKIKKDKPIKTSKRAITW